MVRKIKITLTILVSILFVCTMVGCSGISERYADTITQRYQDGRPLTYAKVLKKLGTPSEKQLVDDSPNFEAGDLVWYEGYGPNDGEKLLEDVMSGKKVKAIYVSFYDGFATYAMYAELDKADFV